MTKWRVIDVNSKIVVEPNFDESVNIMKQGSEIWLMQYDDEKKDWDRIEKIKHYCR